MGVDVNVQNNSSWHEYTYTCTYFFMEKSSKWWILGNVFSLLLLLLCFDEYSLVVFEGCLWRNMAMSLELDSSDFFKSFDSHLTSPIRQFTYWVYFHGGVDIHCNEMRQSSSIISQRVCPFLISQVSRVYIYSYFFSTDHYVLTTYSAAQLHTI